MVAYREGDKEEPSKGSSPEHSTLELVLRDASPDVLSISEEGAIPTPVNLRGNLSGCSIGMSVSSYLSKFVFSKILTSSRSSSMIDILRFVVLNANAQFFGVHYSKVLLSYGYFPVMGTALAQTARIKEI